jgi:hypothetical protein
MEREIISSEMIMSFGYDVENGILEIEFRKGGAVWQYFDFPEIAWSEFYNAESRGRYFLSNIRGQYREARVG